MTAVPSHRRVLVGGSWLIAARTFDRLVGLISIAILARLLKPADFGLVAIANTIVAAIELITAFGFDWALVRLAQPTVEDLNSAWTLRALFGVFTFATLSLLGPTAASFYHQPALQLVLMAMGVASLISSLENIGTVYFRREFAFHKEFLIRSGAKFVGFIVTLTWAVCYRSYWALVAGILAIRVATIGASYLFHPYRPRPSLSNARALLGFSSWLLFGNVVEYSRQKFADLYVGRAYGIGTNGLFAVAGELAIVPITEVAAPINRAAYSKYTEDVRANRNLGPSYVSIASTIWMICLPMAAGIIAVAPEAISLLLGPQWGGAQTVLRWLALGTVFTVMTANTHYVYWALGHARVVAGLGATGLLIVVLTTLVCSRVAGYPGVAFAFALASALLVPVNFSVLRRLASIRFSDLAGRVWRIALGAIVMSAVLWAIFTTSGVVDAKTAMRTLASKVAIGTVTYLLVVWMAWVACGRPSGPESALLEVVRQIARRFQPRLRSGPQG